IQGRRSEDSRQGGKEQSNLRGHAKRHPHLLRRASGGRARGRALQWQWLVRCTTGDRLSISRQRRVWRRRRWPGKANNRLPSGTEREGPSLLWWLQFSGEIVDLSGAATSPPTSPSSSPDKEPGGAARQPIGELPSEECDLRSHSWS